MVCLDCLLVVTSVSGALQRGHYRGLVEAAQGWHEIIPRYEVTAFSNAPWLRNEAWSVGLLGVHGRRLLAGLAILGGAF